MKISLNQQILVATLAGVLFGVALNMAGSQSAIYAPSLYTANIVGKGIFINLLKMVLIPLVFTSIVVGIANLRSHAQMDRVWKVTIIFFLSTSSLAILLGLFVVNVFKLGEGLTISMFEAGMNTINAQSMSLPEYLKEFVAGLFVNPLKAMAQGDILPTIIFATFLGIALVVAKEEQARTLLRFFNELFEIIMMIVGWVMKLLPLGLFALLTELFATQNVALLQTLGKYMIVVVGATLFHGFIVLPLLLFLLTGKRPGFFFAGARDALITAFSTSSSSATLPITLNCTEKNLKVDKDIAGFVCPLGATVNMDGTALYEAVAAVFVANLVGVELTLLQQGIVFVTAMIASIGAPGIPSAGLVTMMMVLQSVGLPVEAVAILIPIDRPLDAVRTAVNVEGDMVGSLVVQKFASR